MTHHSQDLTNSTGLSNGSPDSCDSIARLAPLIAIGEIAWPRHLPINQQRELQAAVKERLRKRLVRMFAELIADDIRRNRQKEA